MLALDDIFAIWDPFTTMASDLDLPYQQVAKWKQRGRIPSEFWPGVIEAAKAKGRKVTLQQLADVNPPRQYASNA